MRVVARHLPGGAAVIPWWVNPPLPGNSPAPGDSRPAPVPRRRNRWYAVVGALLVASVAVVLVRQPGSNGGAPVVRAAPHRSEQATQRLPAHLVKYQQAVDIAAADGLSVWLEADLVKRWLAGSASFSAAIDQVALLSRRNVVGIKIADELGYHDGLTSQEQIGRFLTDTADALHRKAPGRLVLVDIVVPELACLPGWTLAPVSTILCQARARAAHPALQISAVTGYLRLHAIDVVDLSADLFPEHTYNYWGSSQDEGEVLAWRAAHNAGWASLVRLQSRHAFAHPGRYAKPAATATQDLHTYVDLPTSAGAAAVDVWTWDAVYRGQTVRLTDPDMADNALWTQLKRLHDEGAVLYTHFSPTYVQRDVATDLRAIATVFRGVFIAAGTG
jgi:hypothetical protein